MITFSTDYSWIKKKQTHRFEIHSTPQLKADDQYHRDQFDKFQILLLLLVDIHDMFSGLNADDVWQNKLFMIAEYVYISRFDIK